MDSDKASEKRKYPRVSVNFVTVEVYSSVGEPLSPELCFVVNVSEGGMMLRSEREYASGQRILLTFSIPPSAGGSETLIRTDACVVHAQQLQASRFYGVQFRDLGLAERSSLRAYVEAKLSEDKERTATAGRSATPSP